MNKCCNSKILRNNVLGNFPFLEDDFDALTDYELFCKMYGKVKEIYTLFVNGINDDIKEYIDIHFNDILVNAMYDAEEEKLVLYIGGNNG